MPSICIGWLTLIWGYKVIIAIRHPANHTHEQSIWHLGEVTSHLFADALCQIHCWSLFTSLTLFPPLLNISCIYLPEYLDSLSPNPFSIMKIIQQLPVLKWHEISINIWCGVQECISKLFPNVFPPDNAMVLCLQKPCYQFFLLLVEGTVDGLLHPFGILLQGEFSMHLAELGFGSHTAQVGQNIALVICIPYNPAIPQQRGQSYDTYDVCYLWFPWKLKLFHWKANGGILKCTRRWSRWRRAWTRWPNEWIDYWRSLRHSWCT